MKKNLILLFFIALISFACQNNSEKAVKENTDEAAVINTENVVSYHIDVNGMTCTGCENTIKSGVKELSGISEVDANFKEAWATVSFDTTLTSIEEITLKITSKGYQVAGAEPSAKMEELPEPETTE